MYLVFWRQGTQAKDGPAIGLMDGFLGRTSYGLASWQSLRSMSLSSNYSVNILMADALLLSASSVFLRPHIIYPGSSFVRMQYPQMGCYIIYT